MESFLLLLFIFCIPLFLIITLIVLYLQKLPYPPGPKGLPIIGNMLMMNVMTHRGLAKLAEKYGGLLHLKMGILHMIAVSTPDMAQEVLQSQDIVFANRPANLATAYLTYNRADMAFAHYGPYWRQMRKICVMKLFSRRRAESWSSIREEVGSCIKSVSGRVGSEVNIGETVFSLTKNIIYRAAFGSRTSDGQDEFVGIMQEFSKLFGAFNIADFFPWLGWIHGQDFNKRLKNARGSLDRFIDKVIDEHEEKKKLAIRDDHDGVEEDADMVDELMAFCKEDGDDNKGNEDTISITKDNIKALIMDVMFGGTETVASAIEWAMAELMHNPNEMRRVQQELADVVGFNRHFHESDLEKLTYLRCVIKETLRLHPPIPLMLHETAVDCVVDGYRIPAKSRVMVNAWAIGRDKGSWSDPNTFRPGRFLEDKAPDFKGANFDFLPFGSGRRSCPGMQLGLYALDLTVANLCHCFMWELPNGMKPSELDMNDVYGLTAPRATQLVAIPSYRVPISIMEAGF